MVIDGCGGWGTLNLERGTVGLILGCRGRWILRFKLWILDLKFNGRERFDCGFVGVIGVGGVLVAELLDFHELTRNAAKGVGDADVVVKAGVRVGGLGMSGQQELTKVSGSNLEAGRREVNVVVVGQDVEHGFFANAIGGEAFLVQEPVLITTLVPVGDVAG
jgi:hypothetical protein